MNLNELIINEEGIGLCNLLGGANILGNLVMREGGRGKTTLHFLFWICWYNQINVISLTSCQQSNYNLINLHEKLIRLNVWHSRIMHTEIDDNFNKLFGCHSLIVKWKCVYIYNCCLATDSNTLMFTLTWQSLCSYEKNYYLAFFGRDFFSHSTSVISKNHYENSCTKFYRCFLRQNYKITTY